MPICALNAAKGMGMIMKKIIYYCAVVVILIMVTACTHSNNNLEITVGAESTSPLAEQVLTLPFFVEDVSIAVVAFSENEVTLNIANNSEYGFFFRGGIPYWIYSGSQSIKIDYFDGEDWRNIEHRAEAPFDMHDSSDEPHIFWIVNGPELFSIAPHDSIVIDHYTFTYPIQESNQTHFRIRRHIYLDPIYIQPGLFQTLREANEADSNSWFGIGTPRHTLVVEFYWDGQTFHPR